MPGHSSTGGWGPLEAAGSDLWKSESSGDPWSLVSIPCEERAWVGFVCQDGRKQMLSWSHAGRSRQVPPALGVAVPCPRGHFKDLTHLTKCDTDLYYMCPSVCLQSVWKSSTLSLGGVDCGLKAVAYGGGGPIRPVSATCFHPWSLKSLARSLAALHSQGLPSEQ